MAGHWLSHLSLLFVIVNEGAGQAHVFSFSPLLYLFRFLVPSRPLNPTLLWRPPFLFPFRFLESPTSTSSSYLLTPTSSSRLLTPLHRVAFLPLFRKLSSSMTRLSGLQPVAAFVSYLGEDSDAVHADTLTDADADAGVETQAEANAGHVADNLINIEKLTGAPSEAEAEDEANAGEGERASDGPESDEDRDPSFAILDEWGVRMREDAARNRELQGPLGELIRSMHWQLDFETGVLNTMLKPQTKTMDYTKILSGEGMSPPGGTEMMISQQAPDGTAMRMSQ